MRILYVAEPVGKAGLFALKHTLRELKQEFRPDFVWGGGDGATGGFGLGKNHAHYLHKIGLQAVTLGDCTYYKQDVHQVLPVLSFLLRPVNFPEAAPGRGFKVFTTQAGKLAVISLLGQSGFNKLHLPNPMATLEAVLAQIEVKHVVIDYHAATTAEKATLFHWADGRVTAVVGSHMKVPTADARVLPQGTAVITDAGRTGSRQSVGGFTPHKEIERFLTGVPERSTVAWQDLTVQGVLIEADETGRARSIQQFQRSCKEVPHEPADNQTGNDQED
jgi:metallophosphoesterase (TIGR00282 family)